MTHFRTDKKTFSPQKMFTQKTFIYLNKFPNLFANFVHSDVFGQKQRDLWATNGVHQIEPTQRGQFDSLPLFQLVGTVAYGGFHKFSVFVQKILDPFPNFITQNPQSLECRKRDSKIFV